MTEVTTEPTFLIGNVPIYINDMIFDKVPEQGPTRFARELPNAVIVAWYLVLTAGPAFVLWWRHRRITL